MQMISCRPALPISDFPMSPFRIHGGARKDKVVVVMGATGTGKSRLAIDLAVRFAGEVVNSDKMQVYDGLDIVTNKVTDEEMRGVPHHLLGGVPHDAEFTAVDFRRRAGNVVGLVAARGRLPIVAGGSNSYIEALVDVARYNFCFLWVDVELAALSEVIEERVDLMVERGMVEEVRGLFDPAGDYSKGVRRAIGVPELDRYLRGEEADKNGMLAAAIKGIKANTCELACRQLRKIHRLRNRWGVHRVDATRVFRKRGVAANELWADLVLGPSTEIVWRFLHGETSGDMAAATKKMMPAMEAVGATV